MSKPRGFTLLETMITLSLLSVVSVLGFLALRSSAVSSATSEAQGIALASVREALLDMSSEIETAAKADDAAKGVQRLRVTNNGVPVTVGLPGNQVSFQVPLDNTGNSWSTRITYAYTTEDANGNSLLEVAEDTDANKVLTRRIIRTQDLNGDGDTNDSGERRTVGGANDVSNITFTLNADQDVLTIAVAATKAVLNTTKTGSPNTANLARSQNTTRIYMVN